MVYANQTKVNSITSRNGLYVKTTVLVKRLYIIIFVGEIFDSCVFVVVTSCCFVLVFFFFYKILMYMYIRLVNASIFSTPCHDYFYSENAREISGADVIGQ